MTCVPIPCSDQIQDEGPDIEEAPFCLEEKMAGCSRSLLGPSRPGFLALAAYRNQLGEFFKISMPSPFPTTSGMGSELFKKSSRDSVKRGLRTNELDQLVHFTDGEADYK